MNLKDITFELSRIGFVHTTYHPEETGVWDKDNWVIHYLPLINKYNLAHMADPDSYVDNTYTAEELITKLKHVMREETK